MTQGNDWQQQAWGRPVDSGASVGPSVATQPYGAYADPAAPVPPQSVRQAEPPKRRGWIVALVAVVLAFIVLMTGMVSCAGLFGSWATFGADDQSMPSTSGPSIAVIELSGTIQYDGTTCSPEGLKEQLDRAERDDDVKAVVLRVDSGGGVATAGEEMALYVRDFAKPIVVSSASMNASAAYEISSQADWIVTAKTTAIGSIGTAMQVTDLSGLYEKLGINVQDITSAQSKDSSYGTRPLSEEERAYYQDMVDQINETFVQTVAEGRGMDVERVRELATGLTFTGMDAVENGLADQLGTLEDACAKAEELAGADGCAVVRFEQEGLSLEDMLGLYASSSNAGEDFVRSLKELETNGAFAN